MRGSAAFRAAVAPGGVLAGPWVRNDLWRRARAVPSLDLRFADNKSLVDAVTGQSLVTFTRASSGTYVGSDGLIKTATTNLLLRSEEFDNASWTQNNITVSANNIAAPNGATTAEKITETVANNEHNALQAVTVASSTAYTLTCYAKKGERNFLALSPTAPGVANYYTWFNLATGAIAGNTSGNTATITSVGNDWYRCSITRTTGAAQTAINVKLGISNADNTASYTGDGTSGIYIWGAQLEAGTNATAYIPTTTAAVSVLESSWYRQDEGTVYSETQWAFTHSATVPAGLSATWEIDNTATPTNNYCILGNSATTSDQSQGRNSTVGLSRPSISGFGFKQANVLYKTAFGYDSSVLLHSTNRLLSTVNANTVAALMAPHDRLLIGQATGGVSPYQVNGTIKRLCFWPTRLPNSTLQAITQ